MMKRMLGLAALLAVGLAAAAPVCEAVPVLIVSRVALGGNDHFDWGDLGGAFTAVPDPFAIVSDLGTLTATVSNPAGAFERRNQGTGWSGNFAPGDELLWTDNTVGPMVIAFSNPVFGAGAQIQRDTFGAFTARIEAFNALNVSLGFFLLAGNSTSAGDNTAIFLGVLDTTASIARIEYSVDNTTQDFAINQLDVNVNAVPEPATLLLLGSGLAGLAVRRRRS